MHLWRDVLVAIVGTAIVVAMIATYVTTHPPAPRPPQTRGPAVP